MSDTRKHINGNDISKTQKIFSAFKAAAIAAAVISVPVSCASYLTSAAQRGDEKKQELQMDVLCEYDPKPSCE